MLERAMEFSLSGNALKTFARSIPCLARVGNELAIQASPSQLQVGESVTELDRRVPPFIKQVLAQAFSAAQKAPTLAGNVASEVQRTGVKDTATGLAKTVYSKYEATAKEFHNRFASAVQHAIEGCLLCLRTPIASTDNLSLKLPGPDASKVQLDIGMLQWRSLSLLENLLYRLVPQVKLEGKLLNLREMDPTKGIEGIMSYRLWKKTLSSFYVRVCDPNSVLVRPEKFVV